MNNTLKDLTDEFYLFNGWFKEQNPSPANYPLANPDWSKLIKTAVSHLPNYGDDTDDVHYIYEEAMRAIFGPDIFKVLAGIQKEG